MLCIHKHGDGRISWRQPVIASRTLARDLAISQACELAGLPRSTLHYRSHKADESQLVDDLEEVAGQYVTYRMRRVRSQLRRPPYGHRINRKRVQRIMRQKWLLRPIKHRKCRTTDSNHPYPRYANLVKDLEITAPEHVWVKGSFRTK